MTATANGAAAKPRRSPHPMGPPQRTGSPPPKRSRGRGRCSARYRPATHPRATYHWRRAAELAAKLGSRSDFGAASGLASGQTAARPFRELVRRAQGRRNYNPSARGAGDGQPGCMAGLGTPGFFSATIRPRPGRPGRAAAFVLKPAKLGECVAKVRAETSKVYSPPALGPRIMGRLAEERSSVPLTRARARVGPTRGSGATFRQLFDGPCGDGAKARPRHKRPATAKPLRQPSWPR